MSGITHPTIQGKFENPPPLFQFTLLACKNHPDQENTTIYNAPFRMLYLSTKCFAEVIQRCREPSLHHYPKLSSLFPPENQKKNKS